MAVGKTGTTANSMALDKMQHRQCDNQYRQVKSQLVLKECLSLGSGRCQQDSTA